MLKSFSPTIFFNLLFLCLFLSSCGDGVHERGNGTITEETRNVGSFFKLDVEGTYEIVLTEGTNPLVAVETDENLHQYIETKLDGNTLKIRNIEKVEPTEKTRLIIIYQKLDGIKLGGAAQLSNQGVLNAEDLKIRIDGAAIVDLNLRAQELELKLSGAGAVNLEGEVEKQKVELSGAGNFAAFDLKSKDAQIELSGIGSAQIFVTNDLKAEVSGVGGIRFKGDPRNINREVSGMGVIERVE